MARTARLGSQWVKAYFKERGGRLFILERFSVVG